MSYSLRGEGVFQQPARGWVSLESAHFVPRQGRLKHIFGAPFHHAQQAETGQFRAVGFAASRRFLLLRWPDSWDNRTRDRGYAVVDSWRLPGAEKRRGFLVDTRSQ